MTNAGRLWNRFVMNPRGWWLPLLAQCDMANPRLRRVAAAWEAAKGSGRK